jgi:hypothetical protein
VQFLHGEFDQLLVQTDTHPPLYQFSNSDCPIELQLNLRCALTFCNMYLYRLATLIFAKLSTVHSDAAAAVYAFTILECSTAFHISFLLENVEIMKREE